MVILYTLLVLAGSFIAGRLILGELRKERRDYVIVEQKISKESLPPTEVLLQNAAPVVPEVRVDEELLQRVRKLEQLLAEKNSDLVKLQNVLEAERRHQVEFEKIKTLLQWQIFEARKMDKDVKHELKVLMEQGEKFQSEALRLQTELNYKEQLLNQNEVKLSELKNRLKNELSVNPLRADDSSAKTNFEVGDISFEEFDWRKKLSE